MARLVLAAADVHELFHKIDIPPAKAFHFDRPHRRIRRDDGRAVDVLPFGIRGSRVEESFAFFGCERTADRMLAFRKVVDVLSECAPPTARLEHARQHADVHVDRAVRDAGLVAGTLEGCDRLCGDRASKGSFGFPRVVASRVWRQYDSARCNEPIQIRRQVAHRAPEPHEARSFASHAPGAQCGHGQAEARGHFVLGQCASLLLIHTIVPVSLGTRTSRGLASSRICQSGLTRRSVKAESRASRGRSEATSLDGPAISPTIKHVMTLVERHCESLAMLRDTDIDQRGSDPGGAAPGRGGGLRRWGRSPFGRDPRH